MVAMKDMVMTAIAILGMSTLVATSPVPHPEEEQEQVAPTGVGGAPLAFPFRHGVYDYETSVRRRVVNPEVSQSLLPKPEEPVHNGINGTRPVGGWKSRKGHAGLEKDKGLKGKTGEDEIAKDDDDYEDEMLDKYSEGSDAYDEEGDTEDPDDDNTDGENTGEEEEDKGW